MIRTFFTSAVVGIFTILMYVSYAALIFSGPLAPWLPYGLTASFLTGAIGGALTAWRSSLPFAIAGPDSSTCAVIASLVGTLAARAWPNGADPGLLTASLLAIVLSSALTGLLLYCLGAARLGRAIRFIPFPVIGGFLGATGCLILVGMTKIVTGYSLSLANIGQLLELASTEKMLASVAVAAFLLVGRSYWKATFAMPVQLSICIVIFYGILLVSGVSHAEAQAGGWTFSILETRAYAPPWTLDLAQFPWSRLPEFAADCVAVMFVSTISVLLNITAIELATRREATLDRELKVQGIASIVCAALGGYVSSISSGRTNLNFAIGNKSRVAGLIVAAMCLTSTFINPGFLNYMPKFVLGGLLVTMGYDLARRWLVKSIRQLARLEYLSLLAIAFVIMWWGFLPGVSIGVIFGCATFALNSGRIDVVKLAFDGSEYRSSLDRGPRELSLLAENGRELQGLRLQSYLFFGSTNRLYEHVKTLLAKTPQCRFLLFDFRLVTGLDSSAVHSFTQIQQVAETLGARLVLVNLTPALDKVLRDNQFFSNDVLIIPELDRALEFCENAIIAVRRNADDEMGSLRDWLGRALGDTEFGEVLAGKCKRFEFDTDDIIAHQGAPSDSMHFIIEGRVGVLVNMGASSSIRVRSLGPHTTIGEMGLLTGQPRSATVKAEAASVAYELRADEFERMKTEHPALVQALLTYVIRVMAERLGFASKVIGVLQR